MKTKIWIGASMLVILVVAFFITSKVSSTGETISNNFCSEEVCPLDDIKEFRIDASRFEYSPNEIKVKQGDVVKIFIENSDGFHGIRIPDLDIKGNDNVEFIAEEKGEFIWYCNNYCGEGHTRMKGKLIVE